MYHDTYRIGSSKRYTTLVVTNCVDVSCCDFDVLFAKINGIMIYRVVSFDVLFAETNCIVLCCVVSFDVLFSEINWSYHDVLYCEF